MKTLRDLKKIDFSVYEPQVRVSEASNEALKDAENKAYQLKYQIEMQEYLSRNRAFEDNQRVAHGCIMKDYVTKEIKEKLEMEVDWESTLMDDPVELLRRIRKLMTTSPDGEFGHWQLWERLRSLVNCQNRKSDEIPEIFNLQVFVISQINYWT